MKRCKQCLKEFNDEFNFCPECGRPLNIVANTAKSKNLITWLCIIAGILLTTVIIREYMQVKNQQEAIAESQYQKAVAEYRNTPIISDLTINPNWTHYVEGNYIYIEGSVLNNSSKEIRYYEIGIKFLDYLGNVIDTDYTNGSDLSAGEAQKFDTMHKNDSLYSKIQLYVKEVS